MASPQILSPQKNQQIASNPKESVWVMASAGSGKTKVLTDRVLRIMLGGVASNKILCLTYTKAASIEMRKRIYHELQKWAICSNEELAEKLFNLDGVRPNNDLISRARGLLIKNLDAEFKIKIQTIHSFCQSILTSFPFEAKIPINFELIEGNKSKILLKDCQKKISQNSFNDKILYDLIVKINSNISDKTMDELISQLLNKKDKVNFIKDKYLGINNAITEFYRKFNFENNPQTLSNIFAEFLEDLDLKKLKIFCINLSNLGKKLFEKSAQKANEFINNPVIENIGLLQEAFFTKEGPSRKLKLEAKLNENFEDFIKKIDNFNQKYHALQTIENSANLLIIVDKILEDFQRCKSANGLVDYDDLINITNQVLQNTEYCDWIKSRMDSSFDHLLVDEAQDTNQAQWSIIKALIDDFFSGESKSQNPRSVFVVGDEKQSIMGFQGANIEETKNFHDYLQLKSNYELQDINLNVSFRSGKQILSLVDKVFENPILQNALCKIGNYNSHISYRGTLGYVEMWQGDAIKNATKIDAKANTKKSESLKNNSWDIDFTQDSVDDYKDIMAKFVARKIKDWCISQRSVKDKNRPINYGDIMILLRTRNGGLMEKLGRNLTKLEIPFVSVGKIKFSENLLIQDFLSIARFSLLQSDCFNLACLLKSPFFNLEEQELLELCVNKNSQNISLWQSLSTSKYCAPLKNIINFSKNSNCFEFYFAILKDEINQQNIVSRFGAEGLEIANNFLLICQDFIEKNSANIQQFLEFVEQIDPEITLDSNLSNQVKISTVHSSKGLQAPIVIMPDCLYSYSNQPSNKANLLWEEEFPLWINKDSKINKAIKSLYDKKIHENYEEHLRLLYVAITRAEDELYIGGLSEGDAKCWYEIIKSSINLTNENDFKVLDIENIDLPTSNSNFNNSLLNLSNYKFTHNEYNFEPINQSLIIGEKIHKILEIVGNNRHFSKEWLINFVNKFTRNNLSDNDKDSEEISKIVVNFINSNLFDKIFLEDLDAQIFCEYELFGNNQNPAQKNFRIDLVKITQKEILIIDYKTDEITTEASSNSYIKQMTSYKNALQQLYPQSSIKCSILWIKTLRLQSLEIN